jgi:hypothetical protein
MRHACERRIRQVQDKLSNQEATRREVADTLEYRRTRAQVLLERIYRRITYAFPPAGQNVFLIDTHRPKYLILEFAF